MAYPQLAHLTNDLYRKTVDGKVEWQATALEGVYQTSLANHSIQISTQPSRTSGEEDDIRIVIFNDEGTVVESFLDVDLKVEWFKEIGVEKLPYVIMLDFYQLVRRSALGAVKAINDILKELDND